MPVRSKIVATLIVVLAVGGGCVGATPGATVLPATDTVLPPTSTPVPATDTPPPPTATDVPPTHTPSPTVTPIPLPASSALSVSDRATTPALATL